jgi:hypothetical protein
MIICDTDSGEPSQGGDRKTFEVITFLVTAFHFFLMPLSTIFQLYHGISFIGGGNRNTQRQPLTCRKSPTNIH